MLKTTQSFFKSSYELITAKAFLWKSGFRLFLNQEAIDTDGRPLPELPLWERCYAKNRLAFLQKLL